MDFIKTSLQELTIIKPKTFQDARGWFFESYSKNIFEQHNIAVQFVQDNVASSRRGVLRGLHYQLEPYGQAKLVRVLRGAAFDVAVDIRRKSPTFGKFFSIELSESNQTALYVPVGFAHGFCALSDGTIFLYKCSEVYMPQYERTIIWNDPTINISWPRVADEQLISEKDKKGSLLKDADINFRFIL